MEEANSVEDSIRHYAAQASGFKNYKKSREAALKAWNTMRLRRLEKMSKGVKKLNVFENNGIILPPSIKFSTYNIRAPIVTRSKLTSKDNGGIGKELSDGWVANYAVGCTHGCKFCYVDAIHKKFGARRVGDIVYEEWGDYFAIPINLSDCIDDTNWKRWKNKEIMLSSTHDPYLPQTYKWTRKILDRALPEGVRFCIQTRNPLVEKDLELLSDYKDQVRLQVSVSTSNADLARIIEPRVVSPVRRLEILAKAKSFGLNTGIIIAPVFPKLRIRPYVHADLMSIASNLSGVKPDHIYGESLHLRGLNIAYVENVLGQRINLEGFDEEAEKIFHRVLKNHGLSGTWWKEHH